jgi:hypothetical protein
VIVVTASVARQPGDLGWSGDDLAHAKQLVGRLGKDQASLRRSR